MKKESVAAILSVALLFFCTGLTEASANPMINDIRFESPSPTADRIIFQLNGPHLPTGSALPGNNPRVYFDFPETTPANKIKNRIPANGNFVKQIRYAYHKGPKSKTRVVFDLIENRRMDFRQDFDRDTNTLIITLYPAGTDPDLVAVKPEPVAVPPSPAPEPVPVDKPDQPAAPVEKAAKQVQSLEEASLADAMEKDQAAATQEPEPVPAPEAVETQTPPEEMPTISSIPPSPRVTDSLAAPAEEATTIQPLSEVGVQQEEDLEAVPPVLHSIEFDPKSNRGEMISFKLNGFYPPVVFGIEEDIPRIVCFFKNASAGSGLNDMIGTNGQYVKNIKIGKYENPDNIRVVLELVPGYNYDLQQIFFKDDKTFMMIINKAGNRISTQNN